VGNDMEKEHFQARKASLLDKNTLEISLMVKDKVMEY
jgi:hypothetical protein